MSAKKNSLFFSKKRKDKKPKTEAKVAVRYKIKKYKMESYDKGSHPGNVGTMDKEPKEFLFQ